VQKAFFRAFFKRNYKSWVSKGFSVKNKVPLKRNKKEEGLTLRLHHKKEGNVNFKNSVLGKKLGTFPKEVGSLIG